MSTKVKSFWATRGESVSKTFETMVNNEPVKTSIARDIKIGMTVESDSGDRSEDMHIAIIRALNVAYEKEREIWLNDECMKKEIEDLSKIKPEFDEEGNPVIHKNEERKQIRRTPQHGDGQEDSLSGDGEF